MARAETTSTTRSRRPSRAKARPPVAKRRPSTKPRARKHGLSPEVLHYLDTRGYELDPACVPLLRTPEPTRVKGARFSPKRVDRVIESLKRLRHTQGKWAGLSLSPDAWQVAYLIAPVFGWVAPNDDGDIVRIIRKVFVEVPRKNGKTTLIAGLLIYLAFADGEAGAQVLAGAASKDQARFAFDPAKELANAAPALTSVGIKGLRNRIIRAHSTSYVQVVSSAGDLQHGANVHGACIDELHVHKSGNLLEAIETGTGARQQPLVIIITTAGDGQPNTVYENRRTRIEQLAKGALKDPGSWGVVFAAEASDDPFDEATWRKANPGLGISPTMAFMRQAAAEAKASPLDLSKFLRLHLGIRTRQRKSFISLDAWKRNASIVDELTLRGRPAYGGLDLAAVNDLAACCWAFPDEDGPDGGYDLLWRFWTPEDNIARLDKRTDGAATAWVRQGFLRTMPGEAADYGFIRADILADAELFDVQSVGYDPWSAQETATNLSGEGLSMVKVRQGPGTLSSPLKEVQRLSLAGTAEKPLIRHGGNPIMLWMISNLLVVPDSNGNVKPDKSERSEKIDGVSALVTALAEAMTRSAATAADPYMAGHGVSAV